MSYTIKNVADELNVSISTVSRVINEKECVDPETRNKILEHIKKTNYVPNQVARSLKNSSTNIIGIIIPDITEEFFVNVIRGIDEVLTDRKYSIFLADSREDSKNEKKYIQLMLENRVDGLILATVSKDHSSLQPYFDKNVPVVFIDNLPSKKISADSVLIDNGLASEYAVNHLIEKGHKSIAMITGKKNETTGFQRLAGYKQALKDKGIAINDNLIKYGDFKEKSGYQCMKELIDNKENNPFSAVYVCSEKMTYGAIKYISESNMSIFKDIALVGFDVHDKSGLIKPGITSIVQPEEEIGRVVGQLILDRLHEKNKNKNNNITYKIMPKQYLLLKPELIIKDSSL